jgi:hypothetical protein
MESLMLALARSAVMQPRATLGRVARSLCYRSTGLGVALRENERRLLQLRDTAAGKRVFILGNGPSLADTDVDRLCDEVSIASNGIFLLFDHKAYRPTYYTIEDQLVAEDRAEEASALAESLKIFPDDVRHWLRPMPNTLYLNFRRSYSEFPLAGEDDDDDRPLFSRRLEREVFWGGTVTYLNLQLAYHLGAAEVYLIGFDHRYSPPDREDEVEGSVIKSRTNDVNHFDPRYFGAGYRWHEPRVKRMERAYEHARAVFEQDGRRIFNATPGGELEVFERVEYESLFR